MCGLMVIGDQLQELYFERTREIRDVWQKSGKTFFKTMKHLCGREKNVYRSHQFLARY